MACLLSVCAILLACRWASTCCHQRCRYWQNWGLTSTAGCAGEGAGGAASGRQHAGGVQRGRLAVRVRGPEPAVGRLRLRPRRPLPRLGPWPLQVPGKLPVRAL